ncbi:MAG: TIGR02300 family protein [Alphaproteobacteria bacterium]|nr:TIGR02300 family protein [Alphaproteobacteria bacterium]
MAIGTRILTTPSKEATLAKPEWGMKRSCASCGARFYDLQRDPIICPKCETVFDPDQATRLKRARTAPPTPDAKPAAAAAKPAAADEDAELEEAADVEDVEVDDEDDDVLEDASDLNDSDDLDEIVDGVEKTKGDE